jgi:hypothetical protein
VRKKKFVDGFCRTSLPNTNATSLMTFITDSQKFSATRYCGLKGGIIDGD